MKFVFCITACLIQLAAPAQKKCGTAGYMAGRLKSDHVYAQNAARFETRAAASESAYHRGSLSVVTLPVVFHVVYNTAAQNIPDARILEQLDILNKDFRRLNSGIAQVPAVWQGLTADCEINFCLALQDPDGKATGGITRTSTNITAFGTNDAVKTTSVGGKDAWRTKQYINIWVCNLSGGVYGYTSFPGGDTLKDGLVLDYRVVGKTTTAGADSGHTATHEMGHYFSLRHIWADDNGCDSSDFVADTPNQAVSSSGCPAFPSTDACSPNPPGIMFMNFMDYSDDACLMMFTQGQKSRMWLNLDPGIGLRKTLLSSKGCSVPVGIGEAFTLQKLRVAQTATPGIYRISGNKEQLHLKCFDLSGRELYLDRGAENGLVDMTAHPGGIYLLKIYNGSNELIQVSKLVK